LLINLIAPANHNKLILPYNYIPFTQVMPKNVTYVIPEQKQLRLNFLTIVS